MLSNNRNWLAVWGIMNPSCAHAASTAQSHPKS